VAASVYQLVAHDRFGVSAILATEIQN